jgi:hypothetical protein
MIFVLFNMTGVTSEAGTTYLTGEPMFIPVFCESLVGQS